MRTIDKIDTKTEEQIRSQLLNIHLAFYTHTEAKMILPLVQKPFLEGCQPAPEHGSLDGKPDEKITISFATTSQIAQNGLDTAFFATFKPFNIAMNQQDHNLYLIGDTTPRDYFLFHDVCENLRRTVIDNVGAPGSDSVQAINNLLSGSTEDSRMVTNHASNSAAMVTVPVDLYDTEAGEAR